MDREVGCSKYRFYAMFASITLLLLVLACSLSFVSIRNETIQPPTFATRLSGSTYLLSVQTSEPCPGVASQNCTKRSYELCFISATNRPLVIISIPLSDEPG